MSGQSCFFRNPLSLWEFILSLGLLNELPEDPKLLSYFISELFSYAVQDAFVMRKHQKLLSSTLPHVWNVLPYRKKKTIHIFEASLSRQTKHNEWTLTKVKAWDFTTLLRNSDQGVPGVSGSLGSTGEIRNKRLIKVKIQVTKLTGWL